MKKSLILGFMMMVSSVAAFAQEAADVAETEARSEAVCESLYPMPRPPSFGSELNYRLYDAALRQRDANIARCREESGE